MTDNKDNNKDNNKDYARCFMMSLFENRYNPDYIEKVKEVLNEEYVKFLIRYDLIENQLNLYNNDLNLYFANENCVPSLLQLARDYIRRVITENEISAVRVPAEIKDILALKRPIYKI